MDTKTQLERISPEKATALLNANKTNRKLRDGLVEKYAGDMVSGNWTECPVPISIYADGNIADGQHRLWAIIESDTTQSFFVVRNLSREAGLNMDTGATRTLVDNARISGLDAGLSNALVSLACFYDAGTRARKGMSNHERLEIIHRHRPQCEWELSYGPTGRNIRNAPVLAAIARAYQAGSDQDRLLRFCAVLGSGLSDGPEDYAAVTLRNYLIAKGAYGAADSRDIFLKAQNAIYYFLRRRRLGGIKTVKDEAFPLKARNTRGKELDAKPASPKAAAKAPRHRREAVDA